MPETEGAFADPEEAQAVEGDAKEIKVPQKYRIAHRESDGNQNNASNNAFHSSQIIYVTEKQFLYQLTCLRYASTWQVKFGEI